MEAYKKIPLEGMRSQKRGKEIGDNQTLVMESPRCWGG
jgi:hypothetical protein